MSDYRHVLVDGVLLHAHRVAWAEAHGPIPDGMLVHHKCGDKSCVDVDHLQLVTPSEHAKIHNFGQVAAALKRNQTHCVNGHEFTQENTYRRSRRQGGRQCRACHAQLERERRKRRRSGIGPV